ncbi:ABC transporter ATP-binding protein [Tateyamaria sp. SN6-1]|uniref:ABC transporter ATP-binding protein n=1 Tax=Tateyamaria sp. SN6-1 TaxID=3092148 RepID=UPI0039F51092
MAETVFAPWENADETPLIRFRNVTKRFGDFVAIDDLTLDIYEREFFALLGPSGCGKTTMMRMLAGFEDPTEGFIELAGQNIAGVPANKRAVNMMFQSYALFPHLTIWDNIAFGLRRESRDKGAIAARVEEMLKLTRLEKFARRKPHQISGGQRQRVALARSLAKAPKLLLLDEPLGALDAKLREATQFELMDIQEKTGTTFVIVTHDQEEAMTVASRVAVMDEGRVMQVATPTDIYEAPNSAYVADFIGDVTLIDGTAQSRGTPATDAPVTGNDAAPVRGPRPNAQGKWLHDKLLAPVIGARKETGDDASPSNVADEQPEGAGDAPPGGLGIAWAEGQPPLIALDGDPALDGQAVKLALRPEKIGISKTKPDAVNALQGKVIDIAYLGNLSTYHVELADGTMIKAQTANTRRVARRDITWEDDVWVSWSGTAGVVLTT